MVDGEEEIHSEPALFDERDAQQSHKLVTHPNNIVESSKQVSGIPAIATLSHIWYERVKMNGTKWVSWNKLW